MGALALNNSSDIDVEEVVTTLELVLSGEIVEDKAEVGWEVCGLTASSASAAKTLFEFWEGDVVCMGAVGVI